MNHSAGASQALKQMKAASLLLSILAVGALLPGICYAGKPPMAVKVPVADLRSEPHTTAVPGIHDPQQETQLLYGERVRVIDIQEGWAQVEALEQAEYTHKKRWQGYPGWLPLSSLTPATGMMEPTIVVTAKWARLWSDAYRATPLDWQLPLGTALHAIEIAGKLWKIEFVDGSFAWMDYADALPLEQLAKLNLVEKRKLLLHMAGQFIGDNYVWGGRSPHTQDTRIAVSGVDCSGLTSLSYRAIGVAIPRDAHEQYLKAKPVETPQPGDLIFLSEPGNPKHIVHVMLYAGQSEIIEAPQTGSAAHRIGVAQRLGQTLDWLVPGTVVEGQTVFFGSYLLPAKKKH